MRAGPVICGDYWAHQPRGWGSVLACLAGFHRPAMTGHLGDGELAERCKCGAMRLGRAGPWGLAECRWRRVSRAESARLIALDREQDARMRGLQ